MDLALLYHSYTTTCLSKYKFSIVAMSISWLAASGSNQEHMLHRSCYLDSVKEHCNNNSAPVTDRAVLKYLSSY